MERKAYPTDVSDDEWALVAPYLTLITAEAPQRDHSLREVFNGLRWIVRAGAAWRLLPHDLPPWHTVYQQSHRWLKVEGYGCRKSAWERFASADTLVYIDLPLFAHFLWVTKRLCKGFFETPEGWPEGSPMLRGTLNSYRVLWLCHHHLTPKYRELVSEARHHKRVCHLRSAAEIGAFLATIKLEAQST
jgi:transposase